MFGFKNKEETASTRTLGYKVARPLTDLEQKMVGGATDGGGECQTADSSWCTGCDGRCSVADC